MRSKEGFVLIECCVYLTLCVILMTTIMQWITQTVHEAGRSAQALDRAVMSMLVHDVLMRDLQSAPSERSAWIRVLPDQMVWQTQAGITVGWYVQDKQLVRKEGNYNKVSQLWGKHHTSVIAYEVTTFSTDAQGDAHTIHGITSTVCIGESDPSSRYVRIRNGRV